MGNDILLPRFGKTLMLAPIYMTFPINHLETTRKLCLWLENGCLVERLLRTMRRRNQITQKIQVGSYGQTTNMLKRY